MRCMKITTVSVNVRNAIQAGDFYADVLGLAVETEPDLVAVQIGETRLEMVEDPSAGGIHHFAITIPGNKFCQAKVWVQERAEVLGTSDANEFECLPAWNARSFYFSGPEGAVLEFIIRRDLPNSTPGPFTITDLLAISEVGVAVSDVPEVVAGLSRDAEIAPYGGPPVATFAAVGDTDGLLILVEPGRAWFPTGDRFALESPTTITAVGTRVRSYPLGPVSSVKIVASE